MTTIKIHKINGHWAASVDGSDLLPLPFTPDADRQVIMAFYEARFPVVVMDASTR